MEMRKDSYADERICVITQILIGLFVYVRRWAVTKDRNGLSTIVRKCGDQFVT